MTKISWLRTMRNVLGSYHNPAVLIDAEYNVVATNSSYDFRFGGLNGRSSAKCFFLSHGYRQPCDLEGETCPMQEARDSGCRASVLHIHNTPQGKEHVGIDTIPISDDEENAYFIEVINPIRDVSAEPIANKMIGRSRAFNELVDLIQRVGKTDINVLLMGPSGAGKELAAQALHSSSSRADRSFVTVECSGLTDSLFESELFGHTKGAFTGAISSRTGLVQSAHGGTLFLDEVGDVPLHLQVKLLRLIETKTFRPVGDSKAIAADFRLVCATHKDLPAMVERGEFRDDLYHRISTFPIHLPSLAERRQDLPLLVESMLLRIEDKVPLKLTDDAMQLLAQQPFKGNIRELKNILERAAVLRQGELIGADVIKRSLNLIPLSESPGQKKDGLIQMAEQELSLDEIEQRYLQVLMQTFADKGRVAEIAGCSLRTLYRKLEP